VQPRAREVPRPEVWVNCAVSLDGRLAFAGGERARLSSAEDLVRVQRLRAAVDGVVIGVGTVVKDDPSLRVHWELLGTARGKDPTRIILDGTGRTPEKARVLDGSAPTLVATTERARRTYPSHVRTLVAGTREVEVARLWSRLTELGFKRLLVEGGAHVLASVLRERLFDRLTVYYAPLVIGGSTAPPMVAGPESRDLHEAIPLRLVGVENMGEGYVASYTRSR
jgi:2,5-diamino-6-(ribosylamino)-4(3H)-pyrimidinone 5'-phosphate reductase